MKKSKLKIGLVTSFICGMALTACDVTKSKDYVVEFKDYGGSELGLLTENMYGEYLDTDAGLTKYYEKVRDLLILSTFEKITADDATNGLSVKTKFATLKAQAENKVEEQKETARKNAKNNNTSYSDELDEIYESYGVEDKEGLYNHFLLDLEKEQLEDAILDNTTQLTLLKEAWLEKAKPYHIKHMLVKVDGGATDFVRATITESEATKLAKVVTLLKSGSKFDDLAANTLLNDDSADKLGDVGIVNNNATSKSLKMVSEFQLGIYTADVLVNGHADAAGIGMDKKVNVAGEAKENEKTVKENIDIATIPVTAFEKLEDVAKYPEDTNEQVIKDINPVVYPRNVLWNQYFNNHNVFVITGATETFQENTGKSGFKKVTVSGDSANLLCAEDGKIIFGVRSEYGIHFIKIEKSPFESDVDLYYPISLADAEGTTYITGLDDTKDTKDSRLNDIKSAIKSFDSSVEYNLYTKLIAFAKANNIINADNEVTKALLGKIDDHIDDLKDSESYKQDVGMKTVWENYLRLLKLQNQRKAEKWDESYFYTSYNSGKAEPVYVSRLNQDAVIPEAVGNAYVSLCTTSLDNIDTFKQWLEKFLEGGDYYYAK